MRIKKKDSEKLCFVSLVFPTDNKKFRDGHNNCFHAGSQLSVYLGIQLNMPIALSGCL